MGLKIMRFKNMFSVHFVFEASQLKACKNSMVRTYIFLIFSWKQIVISYFFSKQSYVVTAKIFQG